MSDAEKTPWDEFWDGLNSYDRELFRLLQRTHKQLGKGQVMFEHGWMRSQWEIEDFVKERYGVDLNNLPACRVVPPSEIKGE